MDELIKALDENRYSCDQSMTLSEIIASTTKDGQFPRGAYGNLQTLCWYEKKYGHLTVEALRTLTK
jgi:hypothetical protein